MISIRATKADFAVEAVQVRYGIVEIAFADVIAKMKVINRRLDKGFKIMSTLDDTVQGHLYIEDREWHKQYHLYVPKSALILPLETLEFEW